MILTHRVIQVVKGAEKSLDVLNQRLEEVLLLSQKLSTELDVIVGGDSVLYLSAMAERLKASRRQLYSEESARLELEMELERLRSDLLGPSALQIPLSGTADARKLLEGIEVRSVTTDSGECSRCIALLVCARDSC